LELSLEIAKVGDVPQAACGIGGEAVGEEVILTPRGEPLNGPEDQVVRGSLTPNTLVLPLLLGPTYFMMRCFPVAPSSLHRFKAMVTPIAIIPDFMGILS
jgi:hypothetical protein